MNCLRNGEPAPVKDCWCASCSAVAVVATVLSQHPTARQDTRRTGAEKLERIREIANDMLRIAAREPNNEAFQQLTVSANKIHTTLDGEF